MTTSALYDRVRFRGQPVAHPDAVVVEGNVRVTVLAPRLVRLEWSETGVFEDRCTYAFPTRYATSPPAFAVRRDHDALVIDTGALVVRYMPDGSLSGDNLSIAFALNGKP